MDPIVLIWLCGWPVAVVVLLLIMQSNSWGDGLDTQPLYADDGGVAIALGSVWPFLLGIAAVIGVCWAVAQGGNFLNKLVRGGTK